ncbi:hypothetical protein B0H12DRAFT_1068769 [Mycena haematopus]|nr:hypothetical protein B0H12DRAFT_1068769 [Mycena haematopus]
MIWRQCRGGRARLLPAPSLKPLTSGGLRVKAYDKALISLNLNKALTLTANTEEMIKWGKSGINKQHHTYYAHAVFDFSPHDFDNHLDTVTPISSSARPRLFYRVFTRPSPAFTSNISGIIPPRAKKAPVGWISLEGKITAHDLQRPDSPEEGIVPQLPQNFVRFPPSQIRTPARNWLESLAALCRDEAECRGHVIAKSWGEKYESRTCFMIFSPGMKLVILWVFRPAHANYSVVL